MCEFNEFFIFHVVCAYTQNNNNKSINFSNHIIDFIFSLSLAAVLGNRSSESERNIQIFILSSEKKRLSHWINIDGFVCYVLCWMYHNLLTCWFSLFPFFCSCMKLHTIFINFCEIYFKANICIVFFCLCCIHHH